MRRRAALTGEDDSRGVVRPYGHMPLPSILKDRLALPVVGAPMFIVSNPLVGRMARQYADALARIA